MPIEWIDDPDDERPDAWRDDLRPWTPDRPWVPHEPVPPIPPTTAEERMSMLRRAFDPCSRLPLHVMENEAESEVTDDEGGGEATIAWIRSIRDAEREGVLDAEAAAALCYQVAVARADEAHDVEYEMLWARWHELREAYGYPLGESFREAPDYPDEARAIDVRTHARYFERICEILTAAGSPDIAARVAADPEPFDAGRWSPPPDIEAKRERWDAELRHRWRDARPDDGEGPHAAFVAALARRDLTRTDRQVIAACLAALRVENGTMGWQSRARAVRPQVEALPADDAVRAALLRYLAGLEGFSEDEEANGIDDLRETALMAPLFDAAAEFAAREFPHLARDLYWTIEGHGSDWRSQDRALAARKEIEAGMASA